MDCNDIVCSKNDMIQMHTKDYVSQKIEPEIKHVQIAQKRVLSIFEHTFSIISLSPLLGPNVASCFVDFLHR